MHEAEEGVCALIDAYASMEAGTWVYRGAGAGRGGDLFPAF